jgi:hypothetical protein
MYDFEAIIGQRIQHAYVLGIFPMFTPALFQLSNLACYVQSEHEDSRWDVTYTPVPEPGKYVLLGAAVFFASACRLLSRRFVAIVGN